MAKSNAERQKVYRERKKQNDPNFLKKERERANKNRQPIRKLSKIEREKKQEMNKIYCKKYRLKQIIQRSSTLNNTNIVDQPIPRENKEDQDNESSLKSLTNTPETQMPATSCSKETRASSGKKLFVALPFARRKSCSLRKCNAKSLAKARIEIKKLQLKLKAEQRSKKKWQKRYERKNRNNPNASQFNSANNQSLPSTPRTMTKLELIKAGIKPSKVTKELFKKLKVSNCLVAEIKSARRVNKAVQGKKHISTVACGRILKKYKCMSYMHKITGIGRKQMKKISDGEKVLTRSEICRRSVKSNKIRQSVIEFYERDDISRCMPGKKDATKVEGKKTQTRILNDYLHNIHEKYASENPNLKVSFSHFCTLRPRNVKLTSLLSRNTCLCTVHQNMALKLKSLKVYQLEITPNPEVAARTITFENMKAKLELMTADEIEYEQWQRVEVEGKKRMKVVKLCKVLNDFKESFLKEYESFLDHCTRVHEQYSALQTLKTNLPDRHAIIQMDFAENFTCQSTDEIQSAYWNSTMVTIHPVVIYYRDNGNLMHKNLAFISDVNHHNTTAVLAIITKLIPILNEMLPDVEMLHYWTDSPSSQYRNRYIFHLVNKHRELFGIKATWDYFEAGHGKSVCDGIGGACKRMAGEAVKQRKVSIQDGREFYDWAHRNEKSIRYYFYAQEDYERAAEVLQNFNAKVVPGTMKAHAVRNNSDGSLLLRNTSCYCDECMTDHCKTWTKVQTTDTNNRSMPKDKIESPIKTGNYVAAIYERQWYIGEITDTDNSDKTVEIKFMQKSLARGKMQFRWPSKDDVLWLDYSAVLMTIEKPKAVDRFQRFFSITSDDKNKIEELFFE